MKRLIHIVGIMLLASCHQHTEGNIDTVVDTLNEKTYELEHVKPIEVVGRFISPDKTDTLLFRRYSNKTHRYIDSLPIWGDNFMLGDDIDWFRENDIVMKVTTSDGRLVHTDNDAMFVPRAISLSGILPNYDVLAVVWKHQDFSGIKPCHIVSVKDGQWTELGSFTVNTNAFPDTLTDGMIDGFLEKRNGKWMFSDWTEQLQYDGECPMKPLQSILDKKTTEYDFQDNLDYLCFMGFYDYDWAFNHYWMDTSAVDSVAISLRKMNIRMTPYKTVAEIKKEFNTIFDNWLYSYDYQQRDLWLHIIISRMQFHLSNPVTYRYWQPTNEYNPFKVSISPDKKYKFYTTRDVCDGTAGEWITFYQYINENGNVTCKEWQDDRRFDCQGNVVGVWQFSLHDTTFYVLKSVWQGSSCEWAYCMEIATFDKGIPTYHIHFFPDMKEYNEIKKWSYVNGEWEESDWVKEDGSYCVSYTCRFLDVNYNFNPKTLTVTATTQADTGDAVITKRWKLKTSNE